MIGSGQVWFGGICNLQESYTLGALPVRYTPPKGDYATEAQQLADRSS